MEKKLKTKWVKALRSGRYEQGNSYLKFGHKFCCLGVLGAVCKIPLNELDGVAMPSELRPSIREKYPHLLSRELTALAGLNDEAVPFDMIAGLIDSAL